MAAGIETSTTQQTAYVSFTAEIDDQSCRALLSMIAQLIQNGARRIHLLLSTGGGGVSAGFTLYNTLRAFPITLVAHNMGSINSIGNVVFMAADERYASAHSTFLFHGVTWGGSGAALAAPQLKEALSGIEADEKRIAAAISKHSRLKLRESQQFFRDAATIDAATAATKGVVSKVKDLQIPKGVEIHVMT